MRWFSVSALVGLAFAVSGSGASADVIYQFYGTMNGGPYVNQPIGPQLTVTDAAVAAGSMNFSVFNPGPVGCGPSSTPCTVFGDDSDFVSFIYPGFSSQLNPPGTTLGYSFIYNLAFNPDGTLSGNIFEQGFESDTDIGGTGLNWSGDIAADFLFCPQNGCGVAGYFSSAGPIPEPSTWALTLSGLAGLLAVGSLRKRRAA